ncbi:MAG: hypothetical protein GY842_28930 [bacterium]|nr:hypothetical protein [bacterium]
MLDFKLACFDLGDVQDVVDELEQVVAVAANGVVGVELGFGAGSGPG